MRDFELRMSNGGKEMSDFELRISDCGLRGRNFEWRIADCGEENFGCRISDFGLERAEERRFRISPACRRQGLRKVECRCGK